MSGKSKITPEMLMAYADGELDALNAKRVEKAIAADPAMAEQVEKHRELKAKLRAYFDPVAVSPAPERIEAMLKRPAQVVDLDAARQAREAKEKAKAAKPKPVAANSNWWRNFGAVAAALVIGIVLGVTSRSGLGEGGTIAAAGTQLVAQGKMAQALDTQMASKDGLVRLSFRNAEGQYCRVFEAGSQGGVACRQIEGWAIRSYRGDGAAEKGEYRQAGSAAVMADAQNMMAGEPLGPADEKAAMVKGWR